LHGSGNAQSFLLFMGLCKKRNFLVPRTLSQGILRPFGLVSAFNKMR